jgi:hypothetical protein
MVVPERADTLIRPYKHSVTETEANGEVRVGFSVVQ